MAPSYFQLLSASHVLGQGVQLSNSAWKALVSLVNQRLWVVFSLWSSSVCTLSIVDFNIFISVTVCVVPSTLDLTLILYIPYSQWQLQGGGVGGWGWWRLGGGGSWRVVGGRHFPPNIFLLELFILVCCIIDH